MTTPHTAMPTVSLSAEEEDDLLLVVNTGMMSESMQARDELLDAYEPAVSEVAEAIGEAARARAERNIYSLLDKLMYGYDDADAPRGQLTVALAGYRAGALRGART